MCGGGVKKGLQLLTHMYAAQWLPLKLWLQFQLTNNGA